MICIPLMIMLEFSFCDFFGECTVHFIVMYSVMMMGVESVFATAVRESLLSMPLGASCEVAEAPWSVAEWAVALRFDNPRATVPVLLLA